MFERIKSLHRADTTLLYVFFVVHAVVLMLSLGGLDPGFWPKTTLAKLYHHALINALLASVLLVGWIKLMLARAEARAANALAFAGFLLGIGAACAFAFDVGVFVAYLLVAVNLYRLNAPGAVLVPRAADDQGKASKPLEPTR
jgi:hypothetical protein